MIWGNGAELRAFGDRWKGGINHYIEWMRPRIEQCHRVLKKTGTFALHCDKHAVHYLKVMCDEIFGINNFINEVIWHYAGTGRPKRKFKAKHDNILIYSKTNKYYFKPFLVPIKKKRLKQYDHEDEKGKYKIYRNPDGTERSRSYMKPQVMDDVWDLPVINAMAKERLGYRTQKPERLLEIIIKVLSKENDLVLDPFVGGGTTIAVAKRLNRRWIGIDVSPIACATSYERLFDKVKTTDIVDYPVTKRMVMALEPLSFQQWVIIQIGGDLSPTFTSDGGIDGKFPDGTPIEVKQTSAGRPVMQKFHSVIITEKKDKGS